MPDQTPTSTSAMPPIKDIGGAIRESLVGIAILAGVLWLVLGSSPLQWAKLRIGADGIEFEQAKAAIDQAKDSAADVAREMEKLRGDIVNLKTRTAEIDAALKAFTVDRSEANLRNLRDAVAQANDLARTTVSQADRSSTDTAKTLKRLDEAAASLEQSSSRQSPGQAPKLSGWYYLGKVSKDRKTWLPSSALGKVSYVPPLVSDKDILQQIQVGQTELRATGYKYLRADKGTDGARVDAKVIATLGPNVPVRVLELDSSGTDPADGETVLWARVETIPAR